GQGLPMSDVQRFREYARQCLRLAKSVDQAEARRTLLEMALEFAAKAELIEAAVERALRDVKGGDLTTREVDVRRLVSEIAPESAARVGMIEAAVDEALREVRIDVPKDAAATALGDRTTPSRARGASPRKRPGPFVI